MDDTHYVCVRARVCVTGRARATVRERMCALLGFPSVIAGLYIVMLPSHTHPLSLPLNPRI